MSSFRAAARTMDPHGQGWEIYVYRVSVPDRGPIPQSAGILEYRVRRFLVRAALRALVRLFVDLPSSYVRSRVTGEWKIQAVCWSPVKITRTWMTTGDRREAVAAIADGIARGERPQLADATYLGEGGNYDKRFAR